MKNVTKKAACLVLAGAMIASMAACGSSSSSTASSSAASTASSAAASSASSSSSASSASAAVPTTATKSSKDTVVMELSSDPGDLSPYVNAGAAANKIRFAVVYECLFMRGYNLEITPKLATSYEQIDDTTFTFHLREGVKFSNGADMTAEDVVFSVQQARESSYANQYVKTIDIDNIETPDDYTVTFHLTQPDAFFVSCMCSLFIVDKDTYSADPTSFSTNPVGTGPYKVSSWTTGSEVDLVANENYWGGTSPIKNIKFRVIADAVQRSIELETGAVDFLFDVPKEDFDSMSEDPNYTTVSRVGYKQTCLMFNCSEYSVFNDVKLRQAVSYAIDNAAIASVAYAGKADASIGFMTKSMVSYDAKYGDSIFYPQDTAKAKELLAEAGYSGGLSIKMISNSDSGFMASAQIVNSMLQTVGITVDYSSYESAAFNDVYGKPNGGWDIAISSTTAPSGHIVDCWTAYIKSSGQNRTQFNNAEMDELLDKAGKATSDSEMSGYLDQMLTIMNEGVPYYPMVAIWDIYAMTSSLKNFAIYSQNNAFPFDFYFE